jgi:iron(III) transport system ATP-binding protein
VVLSQPASADHLVLVVRPDQVVLVDDGVPAHVDDVSFYGHDAAVRLSLQADGTALVARVTGPRAPAIGDTVHVGVDGAVHAYPAPVRD